MFNNTFKVGSRMGIGIDVHGGEPLSQDLLMRFGAALDRAEDSGPGAVIFVHVRGSGVDGAPAHWPGDTTIHTVNKWEQVLRRLELASATTVVLAEQACSAIALELLLAADFRLAGKTLDIALAGFHGELWPGMSLHRLASQIGVARCRRLVLFETRLRAEEALAWGVVDRLVVDLDDGLSEVSSLLKTARTNHLACRRRLLLDATVISFEEALGAHLAAGHRVLRHEKEVSGSAAASSAA